MQMQKTHSSAGLLSSVIPSSGSASYLIPPSSDVSPSSPNSSKGGSLKNLNLTLKTDNRKKIDEARNREEKADYRSEKVTGLAHFKEMMGLFQKNAELENGQLSLTQFKAAFQNVLGNLTDQDLEQLFLKIDINTDDKINWDEFSSYMILQTEGQKLMSTPSGGQAEFERESRILHRLPLVHKEMIVRIQYIRTLKRYITFCREGTVAFWNEGFKLQRAFLNAGQLWVEKREGNVGEAPKALVETQFQGTGYRWVNDALWMETISKIAMGTDDHQLTIYEGSTLDRLLCFDLERCNVLTLDFHSDIPSSMLIYGTDNGGVSLISFDEASLVQHATRQKGIVDTIYIEREGINQSFKMKQLGSVWRRKAHKQDWVVKASYIPELKCVLSCSSNEHYSLSIAAFGNDKAWEFQTTSVSMGVKCFAYCHTPQTIATGGSDKIIRLWNPHHISIPIATLKGHSAPIVQMSCNKTMGHLISLCTDKTIKVWDIRTNSCLQSIYNSLKQGPENYLSSMLFNQEDGGGTSLITASTTIYKYQLKKDGSGNTEVRSHDFPVRKILYNSLYKQVVSGCDGGIFNIWDMVSGRKCFKFLNGIPVSEVTAMAFDLGQRRLITGSRDGLIKIFNHNNGSLLQELELDDKAEVTAIQFITIKGIAYIIATGWNRKVSMFLDSHKESSVVKPCFVWPSSNLIEKIASHTEDILAMEFCPPCSIATSSFKGDIIICNVNSGLSIQRFNPHDFEPLEFPSQKRSIDKLIFIKEREAIPKAASLISAGGDGIIRFWHIEKEVVYFAKSPRTRNPEPIYALALRQNILVAGDASGFVTIFNIANVALRGDSDDNEDKMITLKSFKCHASTITDIQIIEEYVITSSMDFTVRLFTHSGVFAGQFGQGQAWDLNSSSSLPQPLPTDLAKLIGAEAEAGASTRPTSNKPRSAAAHRHVGEILTGHPSPETLHHPASNKHTISASSPETSHWFSKTIFAREKFATRRKILYNSRELALRAKNYHELTEIPVLTLPRVLN